jgi:hypothetical protein
MNSAAREEWIKLDILNSLARSQRALARILESVADTVEAYPPPVDQVIGNLEAISRYQLTLAQKISGLTKNKRKMGIPAQPWLSVRLQQHPRRTRI